MRQTLYQKHKKGIWHFIKFQAVGVVNFLVDYGVLSFLTAVLGWPIIIANTISYSCGVVNSFVLNRYWTFKIKLKFFSTYTFNLFMLKKPLIIRFNFLSVPFMKFVLVNLISLGINNLAVFILADLYALDKLLAKIIATVFSFTVNFAGNKLLVFRSGDAVAGLSSSAGNTDAGK
ncbi:MAG: GtrA family protein [Christensenellales bacterium]|jgi:putative flippase GtrA